MKICCLYRVRVFHTNFGGGPFRRQQQQQQQRPQQPASPIAQLLQFVPILLLLLWTFMQMPSAPVRPPLDPFLTVISVQLAYPLGRPTQMQEAIAQLLLSRCKTGCIVRA